MITEDPLYRPASDDVPPRLRSAFADARRRLLPAIVQQAYVGAKAAFDRKDYAAAVAASRRCWRLERSGHRERERPAAALGLCDARAGFHDLALKAAAPRLRRPSRRAGSRTSWTHAPASTRRRRRRGAAGHHPAGGAALSGQGADGGLARRRSAHRRRTGARSKRRRWKGRRIPPTIASLLAAAAGWQYQPATLDGKAVKYRKRISCRSFRAALTSLGPWCLVRPWSSVRPLSLVRTKD
jgi:hypothetical protein